MKRHSNLYEQICNLDNLTLADTIAQRGKSKQQDVIGHNKNREGNLLALQQMLLTKSFTTSPYHNFTIKDPKERLISKLPYFPDRILHHAIMNVLEPVIVSMFTADTYSSIKGRGIHSAAAKIRKALKDTTGTKYCLKLDIRKFYPSVNHDVLKALLRRKFKDMDLLWLLDNIIDSAPGLPIGNYLSQYLANYYLTFFDHWLKETKQVKYYFRYADDIVILSGNKPELHSLLADIREYLANNLDLIVKDNYQVFPVEARSIDFIGYRFYHSHTLLRKGIKVNLKHMLAVRKNPASIASYKGWAKHCNSRHLLKKLFINQ